MKAQRTRISLVALLVGGLCLNVLLTATAYVRGAIYVGDLKTLFLAVLSAYAAPLGIVVSGVFAKSAGAAPYGGRLAGWAAISMSGLWSVLLITRTAIFAFASTDSISDLTDYMHTVSSAASFLVAAALTYYFAKDA